ncbi:MAG: efflux RND transporter permease subunit [Burkholderiaceae bacterium]
MKSSTKLNLSLWAIEHPALIRFLMVSLLILGIGSYFQLGQDEDPPFHFRAMVVQAYWPGATASQMADQVTDRLERILQEVPNTDKIVSFSKPGQSTIIFQVKDDFDPNEVADRFYTVRKKMMDMARDLPEGVQGPFFNDDFGDTFGVIYSLAAPDYSQAELNDFVRSARSQLLLVKDVGKVEIFGLQEERVFVQLSRQELARYQLSASSVGQQIAEQNAVVDAGRLDTNAFTIPIKVLGQFGSIEELASMPIRAGQRLLRLEDIATIRRATVDPPSPFVRVNGKPVVALGVSMLKGGDIIALGNNLDAAISKIESQMPIGVTIQQIQNQPKVVAESVHEFLKVLAEAIAIVLAVSLLALGLHRRPLRLDPRPGLIVAIIVVEMMIRKLEEGSDRLAAATAAYELTAIPMLTGTLITAVGFLPIGIAKSVVGEYTYAIFAVTAAALIVSWLVSVLFVPFLGMWLLKVPSRSHGDNESSLRDSSAYQVFRAMVTWCVNNPVKTILATLLTFVLGLAGMSRVEQQFFPDSSRPEILVDVYLVEGAGIEATAATVERIENEARSIEGIDTITSWVGSGAPRFFLPLDIIFPQSNVAQLIIQPQPGFSREAVFNDLHKRIPAAAPEARLRIKLLPNGPPVPYPVQFRLTAERPDALYEVAERVREVMKTHPEVRGLHDNWNERRPVVQINLDLAKARDAGVTSAAVARELQARFSGRVVADYREREKILPIEVELPEKERDSMQDIRDLLVPSTNGRLVPLEKIARLELVWEPGMIWRHNRQYALTLQADVTPGVQGATVALELQKALEPVKASLPVGVGLDIGGTVEESSKGQASIFAGVPIMLFVTLMLLVMQLQSTPRSLMVLATAPLGLAGVAASLLLLQRPFGFVAMLGVIALMGMIMRNAVILIDQIEKERARGLSVRSAIVEATILRFRPITLTAAAAVLAMIPLQSSVFWGPMAVAIMGGLVVATGLTLLSLPALYSLVYAQKEGALP